MTHVIFASLFCFGTLSAMAWADDPAACRAIMCRS